LWCEGTALDPERLIREMTHRVRHRGPDDEGGRVALGHRRLSIAAEALVYPGQLMRRFPDLDRNSQWRLYNLALWEETFGVEC
jgi:hypothetical protein